MFGPVEGFDIADQSVAEHADLGDIGRAMPRQATLALDARSSPSSPQRKRGALPKVHAGMGGKPAVNQLGTCRCAAISGYSSRK